jgi:hypothetical protein
MSGSSILPLSVTIKRLNERGNGVKDSVAGEEEHGMDLTYPLLTSLSIYILNLEYFR